MKKIKKILSAFLIVLFVFAHPVFWVAYAEESLPESTPTEQQVDNTAKVENNVSSAAVTGENSISEPSPEATPPLAETPSPGPESQTTAEPTVVPEVLPSPDPKPSPTPTPVPDETVSQNSEPSVSPTPIPDLDINNEAEVVNEIASTANTGENLIEGPTPTLSLEPTSEPETITPSPTPSPAIINTGDAVSIVEAENSVNSTQVNSQVINQTLNIFVPQNGDINLAAVSFFVANTVFSQNNNEPVINVSVIDNQNFTYLSNDIVSSANTGDNTINGAQEAVITTGNAYSVVSLLNQVNTTFIGSTLHLVTINIFGTVNGNILLPEFDGSQVSCCGEAVQIESSAQVSNNVNSEAVSGQNSIITSDSAGIVTGDAASAVNVVNIINTNFINVVFSQLFINTFGSWTGDFLGWDNLGFLTGGGNLSLETTNTAGSPGDGGGCLGCPDEVSVGNEAKVTNNVSSTANTGGNLVNGGEATIKTGKAYSAISVINFVNSSIINSLGFFGFINIFGFLDGDIGGASMFASDQVTEPEPTSGSKTEAASSQSEEKPFVREEGGLLQVSLNDNIGTHVLPGDTITFFAKVKNPGTAKVYDTKLKISLIKDGVDMGGGIFKIGDIEAGKGFKVTTGLVLSKEAKMGNYIAYAQAWGLVGPADTEISAFGETAFLIGSTGYVSRVPAVVPEVQAAGPAEPVQPEGQTLGVIASSKGLTEEQKLLLLLMASLVTYSGVKGIRERRNLAAIISNHRAFLISRTSSMRTFVARLSTFLSLW